MDKEMQAYLEAMEARLMGRMNENEAHLMGRMNDNQERLLERVRGLDTTVAVLAELARNTNTLMTAIAASLTDLAGRVTRLENKT